MEFSALEPKPETAQKKMNLKKQILEKAQEVEKQIKSLQGEISENLIEVYCLYSYFEFQEQKFSDGMVF